MTHIEHDALTTKILTALKDQPKPMRLKALLGLTGTESRELDRTLQKLRVRGTIEFIPGPGCGWRLPVTKKATT